MCEIEILKSGVQRLAQQNLTSLESNFIFSMSRMVVKPSFLSPSLSDMRNLIFRFCHTQISTPPKNPLIFNYLTNTLNFPKPKALIILNRLFPHHKTLKTLKTPKNVVNYFQSLGFSENQIQSTIINCPRILFAQIETTIKPKVKLFQDFGISGVQFSKFISKNSSLLTRSLNKTLKPCLDTINNILIFSNVQNSNELCRILSRSSWLISSPEKKLLDNISYLKSCGIDGSQLAMILMTQPRIFAFPKSHVRNIVDKVVNLGFSVDSKMFVYALQSFSCISNDTFVKKLGILKEFEFSETECMHMFKTTPALLRVSEDKLRFGLEFFLKTVGAKRSMIVNMPVSLMLSMQDRLIPRYRVVQLLKEKGIMKKEMKSLTLFSITEKTFLMRYIWRYSDHAEELLITYKGHILDSSED